jgi:uncharacterized protein (UPF0332 family)
MSCLALSVNNSGSFTSESLKAFYKNTKPIAENENTLRLIVENMVMAYHYHASLETMNSLTSNQNEICRSAIIAWYYSIYFSSSAMIAAAIGTQQETHASTANCWVKEIALKNLVIEPFSYRLTSLVKAKYESEIKNIRGDNKIDLNNKPANLRDAKGGILSYLQGTADFEREKFELKIKKEKEFKSLNVSDFRTKAAREFRDGKLEKHCVGFLHETFRYRGKANYRDSIYLTYGNDYTEQIKKLCADMQLVSYQFQRMVACYVERRVGAIIWDSFVFDLTKNSTLKLSPDYLKV